MSVLPIVDNLHEANAAIGAKVLLHEIDKDRRADSEWRTVFVSALVDYNRTYKTVKRRLVNAGFHMGWPSFLYQC